MCDACDAKFGEFNRSSLCKKAQSKFKLKKFGIKPDEIVAYQVHRISHHNENCPDTEIITIINGK